LSDADLNAGLAVARHRRFSASCVVLHQDDPAEQFFLLTSGYGRHFVMTEKGRKVLLHWLTAGQVFGGAAILAFPFRYLSSTEILSEGCAVVWDRVSIRQFVTRCPQLLDNALSIAATETVSWAIATLVSLSSDDARGRIAHFLASIACGIGSVASNGIELQISNEDLAAGANVTPFTASRILSDWQRAGILRKSRGKVLLRNPALLLAVPQTNSPSSMFLSPLL
jgi:CRP-like cAMP-binding protein